MNAYDLLENLIQKGVHLWVDNEKLNLRSPKGIMTPEIQAELTAHKAEILTLLRDRDVATKAASVPLSMGLSLQTIGRLIGGFVQKSFVEYKPPVIDPRVMAQKLTVTFRPLPKGYKQLEIIKCREELAENLRNYGVKVLPWEEATTEFNYDINLPLIKFYKSFKIRGVKAEIDAVIDVEKSPNLIRKLGVYIAERLYQIYSQFLLNNQQISVSRIAKLSSWAEDHVAKYIEDPTNTQVIILTNIDKEFVNPLITYQEKINIGINALVRTFSEMVVGVSSEKISILNMNLSDSVFPKKEMEYFVLNSLIPKVFVPIYPLLLNQFTLEQYNPHESNYAAKLVKLGNELASTGLFPPGFKLYEVIKRKSHRDIVNIIVNGRTGVSYGFVAYAEPPQYVGEPEITEDEWQSLLSVAGFSSDEFRQNQKGSYYIKTQVNGEYRYKQIPDIWLVSSRSGANKTDLNLVSDIVRIGLKEKLFLQLPNGINPELVDIKPSYDIYVMLAISLSAALYTPELIKNGAPIVHFHGYPAFEWFKPNEYCVGINNPSVPCGTYESGVLNFLGISSLADQQVENPALVSLIEPDHGTNFIAHDWEYLVERLKAGCTQGQIELGGKHFASLKAKLSDR
ncbi:MAG: non-ribosomal peptide synthase [Mastigocladus sp. ERB_26_1]